MGKHNVVTTDKSFFKDGTIKVLAMQSEVVSDSISNVTQGKFNKILILNSIPTLWFQWYNRNLVVSLRIQPNRIRPNKQFI